MVMVPWRTVNSTKSPGLMPAFRVMVLGTLRPCCLTDTVIKNRGKNMGSVGSIADRREPRVTYLPWRYLFANAESGVPLVTHPACRVGEAVPTHSGIIQP